MAELVQEVVVTAQPSTIFELLTDRARVAWWGTNAGLDSRPDGVYKILVGNTHPSKGEFIEVVPTRKLSSSSVRTNQVTQFRPAQRRW